MLALGLCWKPLGDYLARVADGERDLRVERWVYRLVGIDPRATSAGPSTPPPCSPSPSSAWCCCTVLHAAGAAAAVPRPRRASHPALGVQHSGLLRDEHELAGVLGRGDDGPPRPDGRPRGAELRLRRGGHRVAVALVRGFTRAGTDRLGNFWVDLVRVTFRVLLPLAASWPRSPWCCSARCRTSPPAPTVTTLAGAPPDDHRADRSRPRRRSRSSARTAAGSTTPTPRTPSRTRTRSATCSRTSCCC